MGEFLVHQYKLTWCLTCDDGEGGDGGHGDAAASAAATGTSGDAE